MSYAAGPTGSRRGGCVRIALVALIAILALGWYVLASFRLGGGPQGTPFPMTAASHWVSQDVVLTETQPTTTLRVKITASSWFQGWSPSAVVTAPAYDRPAGRTLDPAFALVEPAVAMVVASGPAESRRAPCAAPCEQTLSLPACSSACVATFDIRLSLDSAAGRDALRVTLRAGMTGYGATPLPAGFDVSIEPLGPVAASATPPGVPS